MVTRLPVLASFAAAAICFAFVNVYAWENVRGWLIPALAIIAAAVLVRLARGVPFTNPDHISADEVHEVTGSFTNLSRSLRTLFLVVLGTILAVGCISPLASLIADFWSRPSDLGNRVGSGGVGLSVGYCIARMVQVAQSDVSITNLQARIIKEAVARRTAKSFEAAQMQPSSFRQPEGYGKPLQ